MRPLLCVIVFCALFFSCKSEEQQPLQLGVWRAELQVSETEVLPFNFEVTSDSTLKIFNAEEVIMVNDVQYSNDSLIFKTPVFEGYVKVFIDKDSLKGHFIKESLDRVVPFKAVYGKTSRFDISNSKTDQNMDGNWEVVFSPNNEDERYIAKGIFKQNGNQVSGTFRTTTGDYRFLEGVMDGNKLKLSTFDGAHAFLFTADVDGDKMQGQFYSGNHWQEPFTAIKNDAYELPDANGLTFLNEGYDTLEFSFPDSEGRMVSLSDNRFKDKVVVVQIMGTWCPNCLDESTYYSTYYNSRSTDDVAFVALAFEYAKTQEKAFQSIKRLKDDVGITYPILLAQYGTSSKQKAREKLPMLNHVLSYPTSIFIDKTGKVRKIHTGFNGPATGEKYTEFKTEFERFIEALLAE